MPLARDCAPTTFTGMLRDRTGAWHLHEVDAAVGRGAPRVLAVRIDGVRIAQVSAGKASAGVGPRWHRSGGQPRETCIRIDHGSDIDEGSGAGAGTRIRVRTVSLTGAAICFEENRAGLRGRALLAADGSRSARRDASLERRPRWYAARHGVLASLKVVLPLLGIQAWLDRVTQPEQDAVKRAVSPFVERVDAVLEALFGWVPGLLSALFGWVPPLLHLLFGWIPDFGFDLIVPAVVVLVSIVGAYAEAAARAKQLRTAREQLERHRRRLLRRTAQLLQARLG